MAAELKSLWSIVLAGGEGTRLRSLVSRIHSDGRPKQFAVLAGTRSLLRQTLDRVARAIPPERTVVVATRAHKRFFPPELSGVDAPRVLVQPRDCGTAAGILFPAHWIARQDPRATVAVFPSDHFISDDRTFMDHVERLASVAERHPNRILLLGARPESPDSAYGWIEPGGKLDGAPSGGLRRVRRFYEKPPPETARACMERGGLWNTFVMVAKVTAFIEAGRRVLPRLHERLLRASPFFETEVEPYAVDRAYALAPAANFSQAVLGTKTSALAVSVLPPLTWSDWGTPERVIESLRREGIAPLWLGDLASTA